MGNGNVLVVSPHPDDETLGCGGVILCHRAVDDRVVVVQVTDGGASRAGGLPTAQMVERRAIETITAANRLGVELVHLALPESSWDEIDLTERLTECLSAVRPDVIYAPSPVDYHPQHLKVASALASTLPHAEQPLVRVWELGVPLTTTLTNLIANVDSVEPQRQVALQAYVTQTSTVQSVARLRKYNRAFWRTGGVVECFWQLTSREYKSVVSAGDWSGRASPFRGFRPRPLADPLSFLQAQNERRRLAQVAASASNTRNVFPSGR